MFNTKHQGRDQIKQTEYNFFRHCQVLYHSQLLAGGQNLSCAKANHCIDPVRAMSLTNSVRKFIDEVLTDTDFILPFLY